MNTDISSLYTLPIHKEARGFFDPVKTREWINEYSVDAFKQRLNKIETADFKLHVTDVHIPDPSKRFTLKEQKDALMNKKDLTFPIKGVFQLVNKKTGQVIDEKKTTIAHVPWVTDRNTVVLNGSEYVVTNQQRLKAGVYTRIKESGEVEAHVNVQSGTGVGGKIILHPEKALFIYQVGTTGIKLYGLLRDLGMPDSEIEKAWGTDIYLKNKQEYDGKELDKFYSKIFRFDKQEENLAPQSVL